MPNAFLVDIKRLGQHSWSDESILILFESDETKYVQHHAGQRFDYITVKHGGGIVMI